MGRNFILSTLLTLFFLIVLTIFWQQEIRYLAPTPIPQNYRAVVVQEKIDLQELVDKEQKKPVHLHFFNPSCPCSRFSTDHFVSLVKEYGDEVAFYVILQYSDDTDAVHQMLAAHGLKLPVITDENKVLAQKCGVYSTPQAVIIDADQQLYYRGNYNRSRYCTDKQTSYARLALETLRAGNRPPVFSELATTAYGCELKNNTSSLLSLLNFQ